MWKLLCSFCHRENWKNLIAEKLCLHNQNTFCRVGKTGAQPWLIISAFNHSPGLLPHQPHFQLNSLNGQVCHMCRQVITYIFKMCLLFCRDNSCLKGKVTLKNSKCLVNNTSTRRRLITSDANYKKNMNLGKNYS